MFMVWIRHLIVVLCAHRLCHQHPPSLMDYMIRFPWWRKWHPTKLMHENYSRVAGHPTLLMAVVSPRRRFEDPTKYNQINHSPCGSTTGIPLSNLQAVQLESPSVSLIESRHSRMKITDWYKSFSVGVAVQSSVPWWDKIVGSEVRWADMPASSTRSPCRIFVPNHCITYLGSFPPNWIPRPLEQRYRPG